MTRILLNNPIANIEVAQIQGENPLLNATRQGWTELADSRTVMRETFFSGSS